MATPTTLPASFVAGNVLTAQQLNDLRGAFRILQVVNATTNTQTSSSVTTYADSTLTATITPSATSSKILCLVDMAGVAKTVGNTQNSVGLRLVRGSTTILQFGTSVGYTNTLLVNIASASCCYLDSPNTTSATTYKVTFANSQVAAAAAVVQQDNPYSSITLLEVSA